MSTIDKTLLESFRKDFDSFSKEIEKKYGMSISIGTISFNSASFSGKITANILNSSGEKVVNPVHEAKASLNLLLAGWKMPQDKKVIGAECILINGEKGIIQDFNSRCSVSPFLVSSDGTTYKIGEHQIYTIGETKNPKR